MDEGLEEPERPKASMVELRRTALFRRPVHLFFGPALFMSGNGVEERKGTRYQAHARPLHAGDRKDNTLPSHVTFAAGHGHRRRRSKASEGNLARKNKNLCRLRPPLLPGNNQPATV